MDDELKNVVEAILFAAARKLELAEIAKLCKRSEAEVLAILTEWKAQLDTSNSPTMLVQDGSAWKLTVRERYVSVIKKVVSKTELPKGHLETLAVVAYKAPVLQSKVIKIRTNKAYDHLAQLENSGFITRERSGRTKLIKLTPKFFEYFDIDPSKLKQKFTSAGDVEKTIEAKEKEIEQIGVDQRKQTEERLEKPQISLQPDQGPAKKLETYPAVQPVEEMLPTGVQIFMERLDGLEVYDLPGAVTEAAPHSHKVHHKKKPAKEHAHAVHHPEAPAEVPATEIPVEIPVLEEIPVEVKPEVLPEAKPRPVKKPKMKKEEKPAEAPVPEAMPGKLTPEQRIAKETAEKAAHAKPREFEEGKGLFPKGIPPEIEAKIEERIKRILGGEEEKKEE